MNNEPVAWMSPHDGTVLSASETDGTGIRNIPLYTHPVKELTDEEIDYCWSHSHGNTPWMKQKAFARAILKKARG